MTGNYPAGVSDEDFTDRCEDDDPPRCYRCGVETTLDDEYPDQCRRCLEEQRRHHDPPVGLPLVTQAGTLHRCRDCRTPIYSTEPVERCTTCNTSASRHAALYAVDVNPAVGSIERRMDGNEPPRRAIDMPRFMHEDGQTIRKIQSTATGEENWFFKRWAETKERPPLRNAHVTSLQGMLNDELDELLQKREKEGARRAIELDIFKLKRPAPDQQRRISITVHQGGEDFYLDGRPVSRIGLVPGTTLEMMLARRVVVLADDQSEPP